MFKRTETLDIAANLINGDRQEDYGPPVKNFQDIATGWSVIFGKEIEPHKVALAMDWLKTCRALTSPDHHDSWIDKVGYTAIGGELVGGSK